MEITHRSKVTGTEVNATIDPIEGHAHVTHADGSVLKLTTDVFARDYERLLKVIDEPAPDEEPTKRRSKR